MQIPPKTAPRIFLIDAYALIYRAFYAFINRPLTNSRGQNTSAAFGFTNFLIDIRESHQPDYLAVVFDAGTSFREVEYPQYKATREKMPDDLRDSLPWIREIIEGFNDAVVELDGYEADDVIGTLARKARAEGLEAVIVSGDKDFYQLLGPGVHLLNPGRGGPTGVAAEWVSEENASEKFGIPPSQVPDYLALIGDASDNVPGARGIGPKTAVKLLRAYPSVEKLLEHAEEVGPPRARASLIEHADEVRLSKRLVTIQTDLSVDLDLEALRVHEPDAERLRNIFSDLEFRRLTERFTQEAGSESRRAPDAEESAAVEPACGIADTAERVSDLVARVREGGVMALHAETSDPDPLRGPLVGIAVAVAPGDSSYLPLAHRQPFALTFEGEHAGEPRNLPDLGSPEMAGLRALLEDPEVRKVGHDLKRIWLALAEAGVTLHGLDMDVMVASYVLDPGRRDHVLEGLALDLLARRIPKRSEIVGVGKSRVPFSDVSVEDACRYAAPGRT